MIVYADLPNVSEKASSLAAALGEKVRPLVLGVPKKADVPGPLVLCIPMAGNEELPRPWLEFLKELGNSKEYYGTKVICFIFGTYEITVPPDSVISRQIKFHLRALGGVASVFPQKISRSTAPSLEAMRGFVMQESARAEAPLPPLLADIRVRAQRPCARLTATDCDLMGEEDDCTSIISDLPDREVLASALLRLPGLRRLRLARADIAGEDFGALEVNPTLESLDLSSNRIQNIDFLRYFPSLKRFEISANEIPTFALSHLPENLIGLNLAKTSARRIISDASIDSLELLLCFQNFIEDFTFLTRVKNVKHLWMGYNSVRALPEEMIELQNLEVLLLAGLRLNSLPPWLAEMPKLASIDITATGVDPAQDPVVLSLRERGVKVVG